MTLRGGKIRLSAARGGFTLAELVISAGLTAFVAAAAMSLMWSVSRESLLTESERTSAMRGHAALRRIGAVIHDSRTVQIDSTSQVTIWNVDDYPTAGSGGGPGDDLAQVSEIETIAYDATTKRITRTYVDFSGASVATITSLNASLGIPGLVTVNLGTYMSATPALAPYKKSDVLADDVQSFSVRGINKGGRPVLVALNITVGSGAAAQSFHKTAQLSGPAYYVSGSGMQTTDGLSGGRQRASAAWTW